MTESRMEQRYRRKDMQTTFYARIQRHTQITSTAREIKELTACLRKCNCQVGQKGRRRNFLDLRTGTKTRVIVVSKKLKCQQREVDFKNTNWKNSAEKIQEQYYLKKEKIILETARQKLQNTKKFLESESERLEKICKTEKARQKISVIAAGILKKNLKTVEDYEKAKMRSKDLSQQLKHAKNRLEGLRGNSSRKLQNYAFSVAQLEKESAKTPSSDPDFIASLITDALNGNESAVQLVAYCPDSCLEMDKTWSLMSELDKDALIRKEMLRDL